MAGARLALVVANEDYADNGLRRLAAPGRDADALAEILGDTAVGGFAVQVLRNESAHQIRVAIEDFFADRARPISCLCISPVTVSRTPRGSCSWRPLIPGRPGWRRPRLRLTS
jgi:hypothetical protein